MKSLRYITLTAFALSVAMTSAAQADWSGTISAAGPLHWFNFEETSGTTADDSGSANVDGTYTGSVMLGTPGLVGNAAMFDGASHVFVGGPSLTGDWTLETIMLADTATGGVSMGIIGADFAATERMAVKAEQWNSTEQLGYTVFGVVDVTFGEPAAATPTDFAHVVLVGTGTGVELFVNGVSASSSTTSTFLSRYAIGTGAVRADGTLVDGLTGAIDELVIYDRALTPAEISSHYAAIPEPASSSLILLGALSLLGLRRR
jgi:hypothetical protein